MATSTHGARVMVDMRKIDDSGIGTYLRNVVPRTVALLPGVQFLLLGRSSQIAPQFREVINCEIVECDVRPLSSREQLLLPRFIPSRLSLYWATHFNVPLLYRGRLLVTVHDIMPMARPDLSGGPLHTWYVKVMMAAIRRRGCAVLSVSEFTKEELERRAGIFGRNITVTPLGVSDAWRHVARRNPPPLSEPYLLFVGIVKPHKNLITLLRAYAEEPAKIPYKLVVVGEREALATKDDASAVYAKRLADRVLFTGHVSQDALEQWMAHAAAYVAPSLYEGFGLPVLEAMACGTPVLASSAASLPEVCGGAAILFDPNSPADLAKRIKDLWDLSEHTRDLMQTSSRKRAAEFDWDRTARITADTLNRELAKD